MREVAVRNAQSLFAKNNLSNSGRFALRFVMWNARRGGGNMGTVLSRGTESNHLRLLRLNWRTRTFLDHFGLY